MNRISYMIGFSWLMLLWATPALTAPTQQEVALAAFRQALQQKETTFALPLGQELSLPLRWSESVNSFSSQGIRTYVGKWQGNSVAYLSIDDKGNVVGNLVYGQGYDISSAGGRLVVAPMRHVAGACGLHSGQTGGETRAGEIGRHLDSPTSATPWFQSEAVEQESPRIADGTFRVFRLAVFMSYNEFNSPKFNRDFNKVKVFWAQLETFLNEIYVRDLGVQFEVVSDERLVEKSYKQVYTYTSGTNLINAAIGTENYDIGLLLDYFDGSGIVGLARLGGVKYEMSKGHAIVTSQSMTTMAHELGHMLGSDHPFAYSVGLWGFGAEPGAGQSVVSYGTSSKTAFVSLACLKEMLRVTPQADSRIPGVYPNTANTAPRIDRSKMKATYRVPQGTFFTIPVYASDAEQTALSYSFNQFGYSKSNPATFPVYPPQHGNVLEFGRKYNGTGSVVTNSEKIPVGKYRFWLTVSDALPTSEAIAKRQAPLYDSYIADVDVVSATPFKITSEVKGKYAVGDKLHLTWSVDKTFFPAGSKVRVVMSDDFGQTYRHVLEPSTENDGECDVYIPQQLMARVATYSIVVPTTGERIDVWFAGKGILRLETIDDDMQYYDLTNQSINGGGIEVEASKVVFKGLPTENYMVIGEQDALPAKPNVTATVDGRSVELSYTETMEGNLTTRTWEVNHDGKTSGVRQFIERKTPEGNGQTPTALQSVTSAGSTAVTVEARNGMFLLSGLSAGMRASVYDLKGKLVAAATSRGGLLRISVPSPGVYIVKVDGRMMKKVISQ